MRISLRLTAAGVINAMRWQRQNLLEMKRPDLGEPPVERRGKADGRTALLDTGFLISPVRRPLTKAQKRARARMARNGQ